MKIINTFLSCIGLTALIIGLILFKFDYENMTVILFSVSLASFLRMALLHFYKLYLIINLKKNNDG